MSKSREEKPDTWADVPFEWTYVEGSDDVYVAIASGVEVGGKGTNLYVCHWHTPTNLPARWQMAGCGLHTVHSLEPLHLEPSLACEDGCPSHGWIRDGRWTNA